MLLFRLKLLKIGAPLGVTTSSVWLSLACASPSDHLFGPACNHLQRTGATLP